MTFAEQYLRIAGPDNNGIYGKLTSAGHKKLVIHIHGMTHNMNHLLEVLAGEFFPNAGFDHFRPSLYERQADSRNLAQSTLTTHAKDVSAILQHFASQYEAVYLCAHSLGALVTLIINPGNVKAISLWDPALDVTNFWASGPYLTHMPEHKLYQMDYGAVFVISEAMVEEIKAYPDPVCQQLATKVNTPVQFIIPELSIFAASPHTKPEHYQAAFAGPFKLVYINGANHQFANLGNPAQLLSATLQWFSQY